ncbi:MAG: hypothetical protein U0T82_17650 [Bacteroidales bacterium]
MNRSLLLFLLPLIIIPGRAQEIPGDSILTLRMKFLEYAIQKDSKAGNIWWTGWLAGYSTATVVQTGIGLAADEKALRQDMYLGAATTLLGAAGQLIAPMVKTGIGSTAQSFSSGSAPSSERVKKYEDLLEQLAAREKEGRAWETHALAGAVNLGSGLITWFGFKRDVWAGLGNFALNTCITEAQIWSQPMKARKDLKYYRDLYLDPTHPYFPDQNRVRLTAYAGPGIISLRITF